MKIYPVFKDRMSQDDFISQIRTIDWEDGSFLRASSLFMLSQKCAEFERTLAMALLCSAIEAMTPKTKQVQFHVWLIKNRLDELTLKEKNELEKAIQSAYKEFLKEPEREGAFHNFKQFLLDNCPKEFRMSPIKVGKKIPNHLTFPKEQAPFEEALSCVYYKFRCSFLHEGFSIAFNLALSKATHCEAFGIETSNGKRYLIDTIRVLPWFSNVVKESLYYFLIKTKKEG